MAFRLDSPHQASHWREFRICGLKLFAGVPMACTNKGGLETIRVSLFLLYGVLAARSESCKRSLDIAEKECV